MGRHNVSMSKENSELLRTLEKLTGLKPSAVIALGLQALKKQQEQK